MSANKITWKEPTGDEVDCTIQVCTKHPRENFSRAREATLDDLRKACEAVGLHSLLLAQLSAAEARTTSQACSRVATETRAVGLMAENGELRSALRQALTVGLAECEALRHSVYEAQVNEERAIEGEAEIQRSLDAHDSKLTAMRVALTNAGVPELEALPFDAHTPEYKRNSRSLGGVERIERLAAERDAAVARAEKAEAKSNEASADATSYATDLYAARHRITELNTFLDQVAEIVDAVHHQSMGPLISGTPDEVVAAVRDAVDEANALRTKLAALTAPVEGEPALQHFEDAWIAAPAGILIAKFVLDQWRAGHAAGLAVATRDAEAAAKDAAVQEMHEPSEEQTRYIRADLHPLAKSLRGKLATAAPESLEGLIGYYLKSAWELGKTVGAAVSYEPSPAPRDLPRATAREVEGMADAAYRTRLGTNPTFGDMRDLALAVADRVRREQCLVTRAVEENIDVRFSIHMDGWKIRTSPQTPDAQWKGPDACRYGLKSADVARVLAEMLGEVGR